MNAKDLLFSVSFRKLRESYFVKKISRPHWDGREFPRYHPNLACRGSLCADHHQPPR